MSSVNPSLLKALLDEDQDDAPEDLDVPAYPGDQDAPLSFMQEQLWFLGRLDPTSTAYHLPRAVRLKGPLDVAALREAFAALVARHDILRTTFHDDDGQPRQRVLPTGRFALPLHDLGPLTPALREAAVREMCERLAGHAFQLDREPALVASVARLGPREHVLAWCMHHIVSDAWSNPIFMRDLADAYQQATQGQPPALPPLRRQYRDFAAWQREQAEAGRYAARLDHWDAHLGDDLVDLDLPTDHARPAVLETRGATHYFEVPAGLAGEIKALCAQLRCTPFVALFAAWQILLARLSGQRGFAVGVPSGNRTRAELQDAIGFFVTTQVFRVDVAADQTLRQVCERVRADARAALAHADLPLDLLMARRGVARDPARTPLYQTLFGLQVGSIGPGLSLPGLEVAREPMPEGGAKMEWSLDMLWDEAKQGPVLHGRLEFNTALYSADTAGRMAERYLRVLRCLASTPDTRVGALDLVAPDEHARLQAWSQGPLGAAFDEPVHAWIARQAAATPAAVAVVSGADSLTYAELMARADDWAAALQACGAGPDAPVAIAMERSLEMVVGILAVLRAGAAYAPLDLDYPAERLGYTLRSSGAGILLVAGGLPEVLREAAPERVLDLRQAPPAGDDWTPVPTHGEHIAYIIYTSGSTGRPKGVANRHAGLANRLRWMQDAYGLEPGDVVLQKTPFGFDVSVWEFLWPLMVGARLVMAAPGDHRDPEKLADLIVRHGVTTLHFVPSMLQAFLACGEAARCASPRRILCSGEALPADVRDAALEAWPGAGLYNLYGPTEAAIDVTATACAREDGGRVPIGAPIQATQAWVLDADLNLTPPGAAGELYLGGVQLARGYVGAAGLTADRFVADPRGDGARLYRTGDLAAWRDDGVLLYLGRTDHQIKIRGFRVELGEIEARLAARPEVGAAVVVAQSTPQGARLVAYVSGSDEAAGAPDAAVLRAALGMALPDYMVPAAIVVLPALPLSDNGKIDRKALPAVNFAQAGGQAAPEGAMEVMLAGIWQEVLGVERVGRDDNFFELGGDSILTLKIVAAVRKQGWRVSPRDVMARQTIAALARAASPLREAAGAQAPAQGEAPFTPAQRGFFLLDPASRDHWNQSVVLRPEGVVDAARLERAMNAVLAAHDAFRLRFEAPGEGWRQRYEAAPVAPRLVRTALRPGEDREARLAALSRSMQGGLDLARGPVVAATWLDEGEAGAGTLLWVAHHLVVDGVSWRVLVDDLQRAYQDPEAALPQGPSLKAWGQALRIYGERPETLAQLDYWKQACGQEPARLPLRRPDGANRVSDQRSVVLSLPAARAQALFAAAARSLRAQAHEVLLSAVAHALGQWMGQDSVRIELEGHGREEGATHLAADRIVGWLTALYPACLPAGAADPGEALAQVKAALRGIPDKGLGYGVLRHLAPEGAVLADLPYPAITFNYLGRVDMAGSGWRWTGESAGADRAGDGRRRNIIDIGVSLREDELRFVWTYSAAMLDEADVRAPAQACLDRLLALAQALDRPGAGRMAPEDFPLAAVTQAQLDRLAVRADDVQDIYPPTPLQEGLLLHTLMTPGSGMYLMQDRYRYGERVDPRAVANAWQAVARRHEALRAGFAWHSGERPVQVILREIEVPVLVHDWRALSQAEGLASLERLLAEERDSGFDMARAPLWRIHLARTAEADLMIVSYHHILMDAWCRSLLLADFFAACEAQARGVEPPRAASVPFRDYIAWLGRQDLAASRQYWRDTLRGFSDITPLPLSMRAEVRADAARAADAVLALTPAQTAALQQMAQRHQLTMNTCAQGAWALWLARCAGVDEVVFGVTVAGRPTELDGIQQTIGLFINTLPLRVAVPCATGASRVGVAQWLRQVQDRNAGLREHEQVSLAEIQANADVPRGSSLFETLFVFENAPVEDALLAQAARIGARADGARTHTNYPLTVVVKPGDALVLQITYDPARFEASEVQAVLTGLRHVLMQFASQPDAALDGIELLDPEQGRLALAAGAGPTPDYPLDAGYAVLFEAQARRHADRIAARDAIGEIRYAALDRLANRHAHALALAGVRRDDVVVVLAERGIAMLAGVLGVFKVNAAYLALDPSQPPQRIAQIFALSRARALVVDPVAARQHASLIDTLRGTVPVLALADVPEAGVDRGPAEPARPGQAAYVIFTSGSTGTPKGVVVTSAGMLNNQLSKVPALALGMDDVIGQTASQSFDISVWQLLAGLLCGACVDIVPDAVARDPQALIRHANARGITVLECVPALIQGMLMGQAEDMPRLRWMLPTGEASPAALARTWFERYPGVPLINAYGPAECADDVALHRLDTAPTDAGAALPIGRATDHTRLYVLDANLAPTPAGVIGELCVAGVGVGRGYLAQPGLSADRFVADPWALTPGARMYRTGDLARWRSDGVLEYAGRRDHQVKVHGFRIELTEIDAVLARQPGIRQAITTVRDDGQGRRLVAYVVPVDPAAAMEGGRQDWWQPAREGLAAALPAYMVPTVWMTLDRLPQTPNGKIDRKGLPAPDPLRTGREHVAPEGPLQQQLARIWGDVLGVAQVGRHDSFFELGGHSLLVMRVVARIQVDLGLEVPLVALFESPTLAAFAEAVDRAGARAQSQDRALQDIGAFIDTLETH